MEHHGRTDIDAVAPPARHHRTATRASSAAGWAGSFRVPSEHLHGLQQQPSLPDAVHLQHSTAHDGPELWRKTRGMFIRITSFSYSSSHSIAAGRSSLASSASALFLLLLAGRQRAPARGFSVYKSERAAAAVTAGMKGTRRWRRTPTLHGIAPRLPRVRCLPPRGGVGRGRERGRRPRSAHPRSPRPPPPRRRRGPGCRGCRARRGRRARRPPPPPAHGRGPRPRVVVLGPGTVSSCVRTELRRGDGSAVRYGVRGGVGRGKVGWVRGQYLWSHHDLQSDAPCGLAMISDGGASSKWRRGCSCGDEARPADGGGEEA